MQIILTYLLEVIRETGVATIFNIVISPLLTLMGGVGINCFQLLLFAKDLKNRNAIKYVIVDKVKDDNIKNFGRRTLIFFLEASWALISLLSILVPCNIFFALCDGVEKGKSIYWYFCSFLIVSIVIGIIIYNVKKKITKKVEKVVPFLAMIEVVILLMIISIIINKKAIMFFAMEISTVLINGTVIYFLQINNWYRDYNRKSLFVCRIIRYVLLVIEILDFFLQVEYAGKWDTLISDVIFLLVFYIAWLEYMIINYTDEKICVDIILHMKNGEEKVTKRKVIQYYGDKIKVKLLNGMEEIINLEQVKYISYRTSNMILKNAKKNNNVKCILKNGDVQMFSYFQMKNDKWIMFSKTENGVNDVIFLKMDDVLKVEEQREVI